MEKVKMINNTKIKLPKKLEGKIEEINYEGTQDGYWAYTKKGFYFEYMGTHTAHEFTQKELIKVIKTVVACDCKECVE